MGMHRCVYICRHTRMHGFHPSARGPCWQLLGEWGAPTWPGTRRGSGTVGVSPAPVLQVKGSVFTVSSAPSPPSWGLTSWMFSDERPSLCFQKLQEGSQAVFAERP